MSKNLAHAINYAKRGWVVIPVNKKIPLVKGWQNSTVPTPDEVEQWWNLYPTANVGIVTGERSGLVVLDVDLKSNGFDTLSKLESEHGKLPETLSVTTGGGGRHYYFKYPATKIGNSAGKIGQGLDIRGDCGQVVAPPSMHESGNEYKWDNGVDPAELPQWLLDKILYNKGSNFSCPSLSQTISEGQRNDTLTRIAGKLWHSGLDVESIKNALHSENQIKCTPPLSSNEVDSIVKSISQYPRTSIIQSTEERLFVPNKKWTNKIADDAWHGYLGELIKHIAPQTESDPVALLIQGLVCFGNVIGRKPYYLVGATEHHLNLFTVIVGNSSSARKGTALDIINKIFDKTNNKTTLRSGLVSGEGLIYHVRDPKEQVDTPNKRKGKADPGVSDKRLLVTETEFASTLKVTKREGNTLSTTLRDAWDGKAVLSTLAKNEPLTATDAHISIIGHITTQELKRHLTDTEISNGFGNRFLWVYVQRSRCLPHGGEISDIDITRFAIRLNEVIASARGTGRIVFNSEARVLWETVYPQLTTEKYGISGALTSRSVAHAIRLASLYALLDGKDKIGLDHLKASLAIIEYCDISCRYIFKELLGDRVADDIYALLSNSPNGVTRTEIRNYFNRNRSSSEIEHALVILYEQKKAFYTTEATNGRPIERWFLSRRDA